MTAGRSFVVREAAPGRLVYESFDVRARPARIERPDGVQRSTVPSQRVAGGRMTRSARATLAVA